MRHLALLLLLGVLAAGCRTTRAAAPIQPVPLEVPPAPPRVVVAAPAPETTLPEPVPELPPPPTPAPARPKPAANATKEPQKPEARPDETAASPAPAAPTGTPSPLLRTPATADAAAAERGVRETIARAQAGLKNVEYPRLSVERQKAYDQALDFLTGAEAQIRAANLEMAKELADKADKLARELQGR